MFRWFRISEGRDDPLEDTDSFQPDAEFPDPDIEELKVRVAALERCIGWDPKAAMAEFAENVNHDNVRILALDARIKDLSERSLKMDERIRNIQNPERCDDYIHKAK